MYPIFGDPDLYYSSQGFVTNLADYDVRENQVGRDQIVLCPPLESSIGFVSVYSFNGTLAFTIELIVVTPIVTSTRRLDWEDELTVTLADGSDFHREISKSRQQIRRSEDILYPFYFNDTHTPTTTLSLELLYRSCVLHVEVRGHALFQLYIGDAAYQSTPDVYKGRSYLDVSLCYYEVNGSHAFNREGAFLTMALAGDSDFFFTTLPAYVRAVPMAELSLFDGSQRMSSVNALKLCDSTSSADLMDLWSSMCGNFLLPPRPSLFTDPSTFTYAFPLAKGNCTVDEYTIHTFLLVRDTSEFPAANLTFDLTAVVVDSHFVQVTREEIVPAPLNVTCDSSEFAAIQDDVTKILEEILSETSALSLERTYEHLLQLDVDRYVTPWSACLRQAEYFFSESNGQVSLNQFKVESLCTDINCTSLFFLDFQLQNRFLSDEECAMTASRIAEADGPASVGWYKACKESVFSERSHKLGRDCVSDLDCHIPAVCSNGTCDVLGRPCETNQDCNVTTSCDYISGICTDGQDTAEDLFLRCFVDQMPLDVQAYIAEKKNISISDKYSAEYFVALKSAFSSIDCISQSGTGMGALEFRRHYIYEESSGSDPNFGCVCGRTIGVTYPWCLDGEFCNLPEECEYSVFSRGYDGEDGSQSKSICRFVTIQSDTDPVGCLNATQCNWDPQITSESQCMGFEFGAGRDFCGVRFDSESPFYYKIQDLPDSGNCANEVVCVTPYKSILLDSMTPDECDTHGVCTALCPLNESQCVAANPFSPSLCYSDAYSESHCEEESGVWADGGALGPVCVLPFRNAPEECIGRGLTYLACADLNVSVCGTGAAPLNDLLRCQVSEWGWCGRGECSEWGRCEDNDVIPPEGACVLPFIYDGDRRYCYAHTTPSQIG